ncbi:hypothetical protein HPB47_012267 [Ixodes persulcatus]|uniref:Uncharacterized protein n=1 Tax=Ixodes persulcatus TaxID=34615 RepID=A0AC60NU30_IXOPE|nr:hypothetical protein HPB47_012267 [Ixodes persulcatus]
MATLDVTIIQELGLEKKGFRAVAPNDKTTSYLSGFKNASHCIVWAASDAKVAGDNRARALILMQFRVDGSLGFPGGVLNLGECPAAAANREMKEEINLDTSKLFVTPNNHLITFVNDHSKVALHFYSLQIGEEDFIKLEKRIVDAPDYGQETLGFFRVPLFNMATGGFETLLRQVFIGMAKEQLLYALVRLGIMTSEEVMTVGCLKKGV